MLTSIILLVCDIINASNNNNGNTPSPFPPFEWVSTTGKNTEHVFFSENYCSFATINNILDSESYAHWQQPLGQAHASS